MLGIRLSWLRTTLGALAVLLLASGAAWAHGGGGGHGGGGHGGGGHGGGGHGGVGHVGSFGHAGIGHVGGFGNGGIGHVGGFGRGVGFSGFGISGVGLGGFGVGGLRNSVYSPGFFRGLGYSPYFGRGYPYGFGYGLGLGYNSGLGYGLGLGYRSGGFGLLGGFGLGFPYYGLGNGLGFYNPGVYGTYPYSYYGYGLSPYSGYSAYYAPSQANSGLVGAQSPTAPPPEDDMAHLLVIVPENAELWFNGTQTKQSGPQREFVSPKLTAGKRYSYDIKARWQENGKTVEQVRTAHVRANNWQVIDFTKPEQSSAEEKK